MDKLFEELDAAVGAVNAAELDWVKATTHAANMAANRKLVESMEIAAIIASGEKGGIAGAEKRVREMLPFQQAVATEIASEDASRVAYAAFQHVLRKYDVLLVKAQCAKK